MKHTKAFNIITGTIIAGMVVFGFFIQQNYERRTEAATKAHLTTILMLRESVLQSYLESLRSEVRLWSQGPAVIEILRRLNETNDKSDQATIAVFGEMNIGEIESAAASPDPGSLNDRVLEFAEHHNYYDVFFISPAGVVLFTVAKEADLGTNLTTGPFAQSGLGRLFQALSSAQGTAVAMEDFSLYPPSNFEAAAFMGARVIADGEFIGIYAVQIPEQQINEVMQFSAGMGRTGEAYLVGEDRLMRSTSRFFDESTVLKSEVSATAVEHAFSDEVGVTELEDYRGVPVYSAYRLFEFEGIRWAMLAEQDVAEAKAPIIETRYWFAGALVLLSTILLLLRFMLVNIALPSSIAVLLGLSLASMESQADD